MISESLISQIPSSPAFLLDETQILDNLQALLNLRTATGCKILYAIKALPLTSLLKLLQSLVDGFSVSSLFEARLAKETTSQLHSLHLTTPGLRPDQFGELALLCSHISFNSWSQFQLMETLANGYATGLRINPQLSFANDLRYDPCRPSSKLGIGITQLPEVLPESVTGLHFHTVFSAESFQPLLQTLNKITPLLEKNPQLNWLNLGGGYLYPSITDQNALIEQIQLLRHSFGLEIFVEPGKAIVGNAGYLLTTVLDSFLSDGKPVLILDTSINHHPEVFEYQRPPRLVNATSGHGKTAIVAGSTCMAGDIFGEYTFESLPQIGDRLLFADVGAYSLIKAHRFNGYNLPDVYRIDQESWCLDKHYDYIDYRRQW